MSKKENVEYLQFPLQVFVKMFPEFAKMLPPVFDFSDSKYIVRVDPANGIVEIGYIEDYWLID
jgi:hypothetical protein